MTRRLLVCVIKPFVSADWWEKSLDLIERPAGEAPCYEMRFDQSGEIHRPELEFAASWKKEIPIN